MDVALLLPTLAGGGAERVFLDLADGLAQDCKVDLVVGSDTGPLREQIPPAVTLVNLQAPRVLAAAPALRRYLHRTRPDVLVSAITHLNVVAVAAARSVRPRVPLVVTHHNTLSSVVTNTAVRRDRLGPLLIRWAYPRADRIVAVSGSVADDLAQTTGLDRRRIDVLYNPINFAELLERSEEPTGHPWLDEKCGPVLVAIGRFQPQKDFGTLLEALALLPDDHRLVILGDGPLRAELERQASDLGIRQRVDMPGFVENPYPFLRAADVFVLSSRWEGLPTVLIEALPFDIGIVATDCPGGGREILADGRWGRLVAVRDPAGIAAAVAAELSTRTTRSPEAWQRYRRDVATAAYRDLLAQVVAAPA